jgi:hypothetical protein
MKPLETANPEASRSKVLHHRARPMPMMLQVEDRGLIYDASQAPPQRRIACFTSLLQLASGNWLACFQIGPQKHSATSTICLCRSTDGGVTWQELNTHFDTQWQGTPGSFNSAELVEVASGKLLLVATWIDRSRPELPLFNPVTEGILPSRLLKAISTDEGSTWSAWEEVPTPGLSGCAGTGPVLQWSDGNIAFPLESFKAYDDVRPIGHAARLLPSDNGGETFGEPVLVAQCPRGNLQYWDQRLCAGRRSGEFIGLFWTHDREQKKDLAVHACRGLLESHQCEVTVWETKIPGQIAAPLLLEDGRWLAFTVDRRQPANMTLWISSDGGQSWPASQALLIYRHDERAQLSQGTENVDFKQYWEDFGKWTFGHPAIRSLDDERVLLSYYAGTPDCMSVHWVRVHVGTSC